MSKRTLYVVKFYDGENDNWEVTTAFTPDEAEQKVKQFMLDEFETEIEYVEAFAIPSCDGYNVKLIKQHKALSKDIPN